MDTKEILTQTRKSGVALGAFNAGNLELVKAVAAAAQSKVSPVILEVSPGEVRHFGMANFLDVVGNLREETGQTILTNLDHGQGLEDCQAAIEAGFDLVHFDGSGLLLDENIKTAKALVEMAHAKGVLVEAEIDRITGDSAVHSGEDPESLQAQSHYTDPIQAADFVRETGVDLLAVFVGNLHGTYAQPPKLDLERLKMLAGLPCFLSLHGGSGLLDEEVRQAVGIGVVKVNVNTELRAAYRETLENVLRGSEEVAVYKIMLPVMAAVQRVVEGKIQLFSEKKVEPAGERSSYQATEPSSMEAIKPMGNQETEDNNLLVKKLV